MPRKKTKVEVEAVEHDRDNIPADIETKTSQNGKVALAASRSQVRGKRKWLTNIMDIPVDVFDEVMFNDFC